MDLLNASSLMLGVVVPLSTMAAVAIGCGDNRKPAHYKNMKPPQAPHRSSKKSGQVSSSKRHRSKKDKNSHVLSTKSGSKKEKSAAVSKKHHRSTESALVRPSIKVHTAKQPSKGAPTIPKTTSSKKQIDLNKSGKSGPAGPSVSKKSSVVINSACADKSKPKQESVKTSGSTQVSVKGSGSAQVSVKSQESKKPSAKVRSAEPINVSLEPHQLFFASSGGLQQITVHNNDTSGQRHAIKVKCSDNGMYRVNPVFTFLEPGKSTSLNVYRNSSVAANPRADKLVVAIAKVSKEETEPMSAFKDDREKHQMMVLPLFVSSVPSAIAEPRCMCVK